MDTPAGPSRPITHSGDGDTFWDIVQSGAEQAAPAQGQHQRFLYSHDDDWQHWRS